MEGRKLMAIIVLILGLLVMTVGIGIKTNNSEDKIPVEESKLEIREDTPETMYALKEDFTKPFKEGRYLVIEKVVRTISDSNKTSYDSYIISEVDVLAGEDRTNDYSKFVSSEELDENKINEASFEEKLGFSYKGMDGAEILIKTLEVCGFDGDIFNAEFDQKTYELTKKTVYFLGEECSVIDKLLDEVTYDEVISSNVSIQTTVSNDGTVIPDCLTASVTYRIGDTSYTAIEFLQFSIFAKEGLDD